MKDLTQAQINKIIESDKEFPAGLTSVGGYLYLSGYNHPLPAGLKR